jgi:hypothetical protein
VVAGIVLDSCLGGGARLALAAATLDRFPLQIKSERELRL